MATTKAQNPLSGEVMFYKNPEPLTPQNHGKLGMKTTTTPFLFAKNAHAVPAIVGEFGPASLSYPIIFAGGDYQPLAIMSVRLNDNLFIQDNGLFPDGVYIPAFIRRYPFVFANVTDQDQLIVCIDRDADFVVENGDTPLFEGEEPSAFTRQCIDFCNSFETERRKTEEFVKTLRELDLFVPREVVFTPRNLDGTEGQPIKVSEHFSPDVDRVRNLPDAVQLELLKTGALQQIYLHWNSLINWERLINETMKRYPNPEPANV